MVRALDTPWISVGNDGDRVVIVTKRAIRCTLCGVWCLDYMEDGVERWCVGCVSDRQTLKAVTAVSSLQETARLKIEVSRLRSELKVAKETATLHTCGSGHAGMAHDGETPTEAIRRMRRSADEYAAAADAAAIGGDSDTARDMCDAALLMHRLILGIAKSGTMSRELSAKAIWALREKRRGCSS